MSEKNLFLGLDCSTQSMSAIVVDYDTAEVVFSKSLNFEKDFSKYNTNAGAVTNPQNPLEVWSYPAMWLDSLDGIMEIVAENIDLSKIGAISTSGQQHASVWLKCNKAFLNIDSTKSLSENFKDRFSTPKAPIWMDASTSQDCADITSKIGSSQKVLELTGSIMIERFTGSQIAKMYRVSPEIYEKTGRIHLNSSFIASVLSGSDAPIDYGDGAGMNLMNIKTFKWDDAMIAATAPNLAHKLPNLAPSTTIIGNIAQYFCDKYGFAKETKIVASTGDNPSSLVGVGAMIEGSAAISLGTSDTYIASTQSPHPAENAHVLGNPSTGFMNLICFRNGSLAREYVKKSVDASWEFFDNTAFENYIPDDDENIIFPFVVDEISPKLKSDGIKFIGKTKEQSSKEDIIRGSIEGQFMNMKIEADSMSDSSANIIVLTGGASKSNGIAQTIADIFNAKVGRLASSENSAGLGAALRACQAYLNCDWADISDKFRVFGDITEPRIDAVNIYKNKIKYFAKMRKDIFKV